MSKRKNLLKILLVAFAVCFTLSMSMMFGSYSVANAETNNIEINGQTVDISSFTTYDGASIRYDAENKGIRFVTGINESVYNQINEIVANANGYVKYGTIVTFSSRAQKCVDAGLDFTKETLDTLIQTSGSKYMDFDTKVFRETPDVAGNVEYTAVLGIKDNNYAKPMTARGYMVVNDGTGEKIYYANYEILNSTAENVSHALLENFIDYNVDSDTKLKAIAEYTKNETKENDGYAMPNDNSLIVYTENSGNSTLEYNQSIGGRSNAVKYTLNNASATWPERVGPSFTSPKLNWTGTSDVDHQKAFNRQNIMGFKYLVVDVFITNEFFIYFPTANRTHAYAKISENGAVVFYEKDSSSDGKTYLVTTDTKYTDVVKIYNEGGTKELTTTYKGAWYVIAIDISCNIDNGWNSSVNTEITLSNENHTLYFDNVRYYRTDEWKNDIVKDYVAKDASEFIMMANGGSYTTFGLGTFGGRENVKIFKEDKVDTNSRVGFMLTDLFTTGNYETLAENRTLASGVKYISFEICRGIDSALTFYAPDALTINNKSGLIGKCPDYVKVYDAEGNQTDTILANEWYTIVVEVKVDESGSTWSAIQFSANWLNFAIDNINYYYNGTPTLWTK